MITGANNLIQYRIRISVNISLYIYRYILILLTDHVFISRLTNPLVHVDLYLKVELLLLEDCNAFIVMCVICVISVGTDIANLYPSNKT